MGRGKSSAYIAIARIVRTRGIRGEVLADIHTCSPARFDSLREVRLEWSHGRAERRILEAAWPHKGRMVLRFSGIETVGAAEGLAGAWVQVEKSRAVALPEGTYFDHDLVGCALRTAEGAYVGCVREVLRIEGNHQLVIEGERGEYLVPASSGICKEISLERKEILVDLPEGLMDLNA